MTALLIRSLVPADRAAWEPLWHDYLAFYKTTVPAEIYDMTFARLTGGDADMAAFVATGANGDFLGIVHTIQHRHCWKIEKVIYLQDLFTVPAARGRGVARALIEKVYAYADSMGAPHVHWLTAEDNYAGRMLYDKVGRRGPFIRYTRPL
ncbi:GNAT family N-acetyltransferase [Neogemmobacter tilapiae]|uniref:GCN5 family N-acetyltransferase n=1 Tax=Neogemmobacter tilapiae TaxID=875041 RepID=A0A918TE21_9RHOB|nr:GNAT family N-acetyltransferase [Gemmobacter tilapiae]GHC44599.1 GCN5 family N-acetyltransferase [Gemmobacter tilapiae]